MKNKTFLLYRAVLILLTSFLIFSASAQQQFRHSYILKEKWLKYGTLYPIKKEDKIINIGSFTQKNYYIQKDTLHHKDSLYIKEETIYLKNKTSVSYADTLHPMKLLNRNQKVHATIEINEAKDSFAVKFWYPENPDKIFWDPINKNNVTISSDDDYVFIPNDEKDWQNTLLGSHPCLHLPYRHWQLSAITLPFRLNIKDGSQKFGFANANISVVHVWGNTTVYKSPFVATKNIYYGIGGFVGITEAETSDSFCATFGCNTLISLYNFHIVPALGINCQDGGLKEKNIYFAIGLGFKLMDIFSPNSAD